MGLLWLVFRRYSLTGDVLSQVFSCLDDLYVLEMFIYVKCTYLTECSHSSTIYVREVFTSIRVRVQEIFAGVFNALAEQI